MRPASVWQVLVALALGACAGQSPAPPPTPGPGVPASASSAAPAPRLLSPGLHFEVSAVDPKADPCRSFYDHACGGWRATHPIPPDKTRWNRYAEMTEVNLERERAIIEGAAKSAAAATPAEKRVGAYYTACMDEKGIEARGLEPIRATLASIAAIRSAKDVTPVLADLHAHDVAPLFWAEAGTDPRDASQVILWLDRGALGLPDPGDYEKNDDASVARRARYVEHLERLFGLLGDSGADAKTAAQRLLAFEAKLAKKALSRAERRRRENVQHPMTVAELTKRFGAIDWKAYFTAIGLPNLERVNVAQPAWADAVDQAIRAKNLSALRDELRMLLVRSMARVLPRAIEAEVFDFRERTLRGAKEMAPRSKRCIGLVDDHVGIDVGRIFVARYNKDDARARVKTMIDALVAAFRADLDAAEWLGAEARAEAKTKLAKMLVVTGMSNRPRSLEALRVEPDDALGNAWRGQAAYVADDRAQVGKPTDRESFFESLPQSTDGFGSKTLNATGFTAGFLQPPVFDPEMDDAVNFGGLGSVIGHELSHQLDDEGRKYDADGNQRMWWSPADVARFEERAQCFVDEYSRFTIDDGTHVDGKLTLGENIADNGGIRLSYAALRPSERGPSIDGYTPAQRFFLAWAQIRCENVTPEAQKLQVQTDQHAPGRWRVDGVVSNMPEFAHAFSCKPGAPMAPAKRCAVW